jgi:hypothetical protein
VSADLDVSPLAMEDNLRVTCTNTISTDVIKLLSV